MANPVDKKTVTFRLSAKARQVLFNITRNKEGGYKADEVVDAAELLKLIRKDATARTVTLPDNIGGMQDVVVYENFSSDAFEVTPEQVILAKAQFNAVKGWDADRDLEVFLELRNLFE